MVILMIDVKIEIKNKKRKEEYEFLKIDDKFHDKLYGIMATIMEN